MHSHACLLIYFPQTHIGWFPIIITIIYRYISHSNPASAAPSQHYTIHKTHTDSTTFVDTVQTKSERLRHCRTLSPADKFSRWQRTAKHIIQPVRVPTVTHLSLTSELMATAAQRCATCSQMDGSPAKLSFTAIRSPSY